MSQSEIYGPLGRNVESDFDCALDVIISRAGPRTLAEGISFLDLAVAVLAIGRISSSLPDLKIHNLDATRLTQEYRLLFIFLSGLRQCGRLCQNIQPFDSRIHLHLENRCL